jgi:enhancing lycopene biosynthesis protein 2
MQVAVVLAGCGVYDGTEVHEAAAILAAITRHGGRPVM